MPLRYHLNRILDALVRPQVTIRGRALPAFQLCGYAGLACAVTLALTLVARAGLSPVIMLLLIVSSVLTFFALAYASRLISGEEQLVYYHHEIAVLCVATLVLLALGQPLLPYLDATILGVGAFLACGRIGCLMVGCCHGRPHAWGVCYRPAHAAEGFPRYYVGVRMFPTQAIESAWVLCVVIVGSGMVLAGRAPGAAFAWYVVAYDIGRFLLEFMRGDRGRPYYGGFSEAQWISMALTLLVAGAELAGWLPLEWWHAGAALGLVLIAALAAWRRRGQRPVLYALLLPGHVAEIAAATAPRWLSLTESAGPDPVACTSLGIMISAGTAPAAGGPARLYTLSWRDGPLSDRAARVLADLIMRLRHPAARADLVKGGQATFHLIVNP